jgi:hypothetical protein
VDEVNIISNLCLGVFVRLLCPVDRQDKIPVLSLFSFGKPARDDHLT